MPQTFGTQTTGGTAQTILSPDATRTFINFEAFDELTYIQIGSIPQVETATVLGLITVAGNGSLVVTAAGMAGSPITVPFAVLVGDDQYVIAQKARKALIANAVINAFMNIQNGMAGGIGLSNLIQATLNTIAANDATLNIAIADGTSTGITTAATSANTTVGRLGAVASQSYQVQPGAITGWNLAAGDDVGGNISIISATTGSKWFVEYGNN